MADVTLRVNGRLYGGWKSARIVRGVEAISGAFELGITDRWGRQDRPWPIYEEDECSLLVDSEPLITGWVDKASRSFGPSEHSFSVSGRDRAGALVDCSAELTAWEFRDLPLLTLARRLAEPFKISVRLQPGLELPKVAKLSVDPGDTAFDALERACRMVGVLPVSDGTGGVVLTRVGTARATTALVQGENILSASGEFDSAERYRRYVVTGQSSGSDSLFGEGAARIRAEASDGNVRRAERVLLVRAESNATPATARQRAAWEASVRAGRAVRATVTVQGWFQADGSLWPVNSLVQLRSPFLGIDGELLITEAVYELGDQGTTTTLTLKRPDAFLPEPEIPARSDPVRFAPAPVESREPEVPLMSSEDDLVSWDPEQLP